MHSQVRYQYRSPQKIQGESDSVEKQLRRGRIQGGARGSFGREGRGGEGGEGEGGGGGRTQGGARGSFGREGRGAPKERQLEATSDYGTMSRQSQMINNEREQLFNIARSKHESAIPIP